jgi:CBS-domain-containing membrane protein
MSKDLETVDDTMSRDQAARVLERNKNHHAIVVDSNKHFKGVVSSWDITVECAKDDRAFPWNRSPDGRFHSPNEKPDLGTSPTSTTESPINQQPVGLHRSQMGDSFRAYIDNLGYFD